MKNRKKIISTICSSAAAITLAVTIALSGPLSKAAEFSGTTDDVPSETEISLEDSINLADENEDLYKKSSDSDYELVLPASDEYTLTDTRRSHIIVEDGNVSHNGVELENGGSVSRYDYGDDVKLKLEIADGSTLGTLYVFDSYGNESEASYDENTGYITFSMPDSNAIVTVCVMEENAGLYKEQNIAGKTGSGDPASELPEIGDTDQIQENTEGSVEESIVTQEQETIDDDAEDVQEQPLKTALSSMIEMTADTISRPVSAYAAGGNNTVSSALGISANTVISWLKSHEDDNYYLNTPYKSAASAGSNGTSDYRNPNGEPTGYGFCTNSGVGMQCTGFVWHVLVSAGSNPWQTPHLAKQYPGTSGGWTAFINSNGIRYYDYSSKSSMLASGVLEKGDIIYSIDMSAAGGVSNYHHVGFFWGDYSNQDSYWHSGPRQNANLQTEINCISTINSKVTNVTWRVIKLGTVAPVYANTSYTAREALSPSLDIHIEKTDEETGEYLESAQFDVYMDNNKVATVTTGSNGRTAYHWRGEAVYTVYRTSSSKRYCVNYDDLSQSNKNAINNNSSVYNNLSAAYTAARNETVSQVNSDLVNLKSSTRHTWKVVESKAPDGYELNDKVWEQTLDANVTVIEVDFTNVSDGKPVQVIKSSGNSSLTEGNSCYSLQGAEYGIYETKEDALKDENRIETLTTDLNGETDTVDLKKGTWYIKEVKASPGYLLCNGEIDQTENGIHEIVIDNSKDLFTVECSDPPCDDPFNLILNKMDIDTNGESQGIATTEGAIFEVNYYQNTESDVSGTPDNTWYFKTDEDGFLNCQNDKYYVDSYSLSGGRTLNSDNLYIDDGAVVYPIGTYLIKEVSPPKYYQLSGTMNFIEYPDNKVDITEGLKLVIKQTENGADPKRYDGNDPVNGVISAENFTINVYDQVRLGSITIYKEKADGTKEPLSGVTFKLKGIEEGDEQTLTTNENGVISFGNLIPQNYVITEIKTQSGFSLLKDNINAVLPVEMSLDEIDEYGADIGKAIFDEVSQKYCFYDISFTVGDSVTFDMPFTGGNEIPVVIIVIGSAVILSGVLLFAGKKKKMRAHQD